MPPHSNIIPPPHYIVTTKSAFGGKQGVCGIILEYHFQGTLREILMSRTLAKTLDLKGQLSWTRQIVSALIHINDKTNTIYSNLKPDNLLMVQTSSTSRELTPTFVDFEQRGNGIVWYCVVSSLHSLRSVSGGAIRMSSHQASTLGTPLSCKAT